MSQSLPLPTAFCLTVYVRVCVPLPQFLLQLLYALHTPTQSTGHACLLHSRCCFVPSPAEHFVPPFLACVLITYSLICFPPPHFALHSPYSLHAPVQFTTVGDGGGGGAGRLTHFDERQILSSSAVPQGVPSRTLTATLEDVNARLVSHLQYECFADHKNYRMISKTANKRAKRARCTVVESKSGNK